MKTLLIATTALIGAASVAVASSASARETASSHYQLDANQESLCNYGFSVYARAYWEDSSETAAGQSWVRAAVPVRGQGKLVSEIVVADSPSSSATAGVSVAIYSGKKWPVYELAGAQVKPSQKCGLVRVPISPTQLQKGKKYWVVETAVSPRLGEDSSSAENSIT